MKYEKPWHLIRLRNFATKNLWLRKNRMYTSISPSIEWDNGKNDANYKGESKGMFVTKRKSRNLPTEIIFKLSHYSTRWKVRESIYLNRKANQRYLNYVIFYR